MKPKFKDSLVPQILQDEGIKIFKLIFDNNSKDLQYMFFTHPFIRKIWEPIIVGNLKEDKCFPLG